MSVFPSQAFKYHEPVESGLSIVLGGIHRTYALYRSRRKSISIQVKPGGILQVRAPLWVPVREIEGFLRQKEAWIESVLNQTAMQSHAPDRLFEDGEQFPFLGQVYFLGVREEPARKRILVRLAEDHILLTAGPDCDQEARKNALQNWYREQAREILTAKADRFSDALGVTYGTLRIKQQKSRWGSCSSRGNLNFNWHIVMAPETIADYLVIHELSHLRYMDHSRDFWNCVASLYPNYPAARKWLRDNGSQLKNW